jgi:hypothetical protein
MSDYPTEQDIHELEGVTEPFAVSVYVPHLQPNTADNPNRIELKNLLKQAETALDSIGVEPRLKKKTLRPAKELLTSPGFWPVQRGSLALFMHPKLFRHFRLPEEGVPYLLTVEQGFNLEPLKAAFADNEGYLLLALGHQDVRLYEGDRYRLRAVRLKNFATNILDALQIDEFPSWQETHQVAPARAGRGSRAYHGQYNVSQTDKEMLLEFFRLIDKRLHRLLQERQLPLILAGVGYVTSLYRQVNTYTRLVSKSIEGTIDRQSPQAVINAAWATLKQSEST